MCNEIVCYDDETGWENGAFKSFLFSIEILINDQHECVWHVPFLF